MADVRIGALRYDLVADTEKFEKSMTATRTELNQARKSMRETRTPAEKYGESIERLNNLRRKGLLTAKDYRRALAKEEQAYRSAGKAAKTYGTAMGGMTRHMKTAATAMAAYVSVRATIGQVAGQFAEVDEIAKTAEKLGLLENELIAVRFAAERMSGMGASQVDMALQRMTRRLSEAANGTGEARDALKELGLDARRLNLMGPADAFAAIGDAIKDVQNPADQLRLAFKLFDSEGAALVNTLKGGSDGLAEMAAEAEKLGLTFDSIEADRIEAANDAVTGLKDAWKGLVRELSISTAPAVEKAAVLLEGLLKRYNNARERLGGGGAIEQAEAANILRSRRGEEEVRVIGGDPAEYHKQRAEALRAAAQERKQEADDEKRFLEAQEHNIRRLAELKKEKDEEARKDREKQFQEMMRFDTELAKLQEQRQLQQAQAAVKAADAALREFEKAQPKAFGGRGAVGTQRGSREEYAILRDIKRQKDDSSKRAKAEARAAQQRDRLIVAQEQAAAALDEIKNKDAPVAGV